MHRTCLVRQYSLLFTLIAIGCLAGANRASADTAVPCRSAVRPCDSIWLVSTRGLLCGDPRLQVNRLSYKFLNENNQWQNADLATFLAADDPGTTTVFWMHGNRSTRAQAISEGLGTYRGMARCSTCDTPMRFVIFSWPADRIDGGQLDDIRIKAYRTDSQGYYLAWLMDRVRPDVRVSVIGYSYGARIAAAALHFLGGGRVNGWALEERVHPGRRAIHAALVAAAIDNHWLLPGHRYGRALSQTAHMTIIYNPCDRVLKRYRFLYCRKSSAQALGYTGFAGLNRLSATDRRKIRQINSSPYMGKSHDVNISYTVGAMNAALVRECLPKVQAVAN